MKRLTPIVLGPLLLVSCTKILGVDYDYRLAGDTTTSSTTGTGTGGAGPCGAYVWDALPSCEQCAESSCCAELKLCDDGTPCAEIAACAAACGAKDIACLTTCVNDDTTKHQSQGAIDFGNLSYCVAAQCSTSVACSFPICGTSFTWSKRSCSDCLSGDATCCAAFTQCSTDSVCSACMLTNDAAPACATNAIFQQIVGCLNGEGCGRDCAFDVCDDLAYGYAETHCNFCLSQQSGGCCTEFDACRGDTACAACLEPSAPASCSSNNKLQAFYDCISASCYVQCSGI